MLRRVTQEGPDEEDAPKESGNRFPNTQWSMVIAAGNGTEETRRALDRLCESYWKPIYSYLRHRWTECDAKDLTQGFFEGLLRRDDFSRLTSERGKFRTFLLSSLKNYLANDWDRRNALKRGGGAQHLSLDYLIAERAYTHEPCDELTPDKLYEIQYARTVFERGMKRLRTKFRKRRKEDLLDELLPFLTPNARDLSFKEVALRLECTEGAARKAAHDIRKKLRDCVSAEVAQTVERREDIEEEISYLIGIIGNAR